MAFFKRTNKITTSSTSCTQDKTHSLSSTNAYSQTLPSSTQGAQLTNTSKRGLLGPDETREMIAEKSMTIDFGILSIR
jgi:hypothetical protein